MGKRKQSLLFDTDEPAREPVPEGFTYEPEFISPSEEKDLLSEIGKLEFKTFTWHGFIAKRRIVDYGWSYSFETMKLTPGDPIPEFLLPVRSRAAARVGIRDEQLSEALITEYQSGAAIDWHRDVPQFEIVMGISLLSACMFRLRRKRGATWERYSFVAEPRSLYILTGPARDEWQHSIPAAETLRYSITFRSRRETVPSKRSVK